MSNFILTMATYPNSSTITVPMDCVKRCYSFTFLRTFIVARDSQGIKIKIIKTATGALRRYPSVYRGETLDINEFVISRDVIENKFNDPHYQSIDFYICTNPLNEIYLILERNDKECGNNGPGGGDGLKVKLPS